MPICDNIIIRKHQTPEKVNLLDGRALLARYKCVTRGHLPPNVRMRQCCKQRAAPEGRRSC